MFANGLISKSDFYSKLLERSECFVETIDDKECNRDVLKHNLNVLIDLCDKRLAIEGHSHSSGNSDGSHCSETEDHIDCSQQLSDQSIEECIERAKKWVTVVKVDNKTRYKCSFDRSCDYQALSMTDAVSHVFKHTDERPFKCDHVGCDYNYRYLKQLRCHQRRHLGVKERRKR